MEKLQKDRYYVCTHPDHSSVLEIFSGANLERVLEYDKRYKMVMTTADREDALHFVEEVVRAALERDPELAHFKRDVEALYS
ncbi:MAG: hypothetical protein IJM90_00610 [Firmicutes bacterium]|nr:hypothetical protein [Bacillota bacterium]